MADTLHLSVVTPERAVLETEARSVRFTAHDGEIGFLPNRAPLLIRVGVGSLRADTVEGQRRMFIDSGFAQMVDNRLTVLTEEALDLSDIDGDAARLALEAALAMPTATAKEVEDRQRAIERARVQRQLVTAG